MELSNLYQTYGKIKKNQATPRQMFKIMVYASMNRLYSSRDIEIACCRDINFIFLLEGKPAPDHAIFARFISLYFAQWSKKTLAEVSKFLYSLGEIFGKSIFIDGTKMKLLRTNILLSRKRLLRKIRQNFSIRSLSLWKSVKIFTVSESLVMGKSLCIH